MAAASAVAELFSETRREHHRWHVFGDGYGLTMECRQHDDFSGAGAAHQAVCQTLALLGIADLPLAPPARPFECPALVAVVDRHDESAASPEPGAAPTLWQRLR